MPAGEAAELVRPAPEAVVRPHAWLRAHLWLFPPSCRQCGRLLAPVSRAAGATVPPAPTHPFLCTACHAALPWWPDAPGEAGSSAGGDAGAIAGVDRLWAACRYAEPMDGWIQRLKYERRDGLVRLLAAVLDAAPAGRVPLADAPLLVPVPLHPWRLWRRGFNQCLLVAHAWLRCAAGETGARLAPDVLVRHRYTRPQVHMSGAERRTNVADAFSLHRRLAGREAPLRGQRVLLVDDVTTTGATLSACAQVLRTAGAERVEALVLARV